MKFGIFYEHQLPRPWDADARAPHLSRGARSGRARRPHRHRLRLGGRASFPRGIFPFLGAGSVSRRLLATHQAHPPRPRHRADAAWATIIRRASPSASPRSISSPTGASSSAPANPRRSSSSAAIACRRREARDVAGIARAMPQHDGDESLSRFRGQIFLDAVPQRRAEAVAEAASAGLGRLLQPRDDQARRAARHRRADLRLRRSGGGQAMGRRLLPHHQDGVRADRPCGQRQHRDGDRLLGASRRRGSEAPRRGRVQLLRLCAGAPLYFRRAQAGPHGYLGGLRKGAGRAPRGRRRARHRHAGRSSAHISRASRIRASIRSPSSSKAGATGTSISANRWSCSRATSCRNSMRARKRGPSARQEELAPFIEQAMARKQKMAPLAEDKIPSFIALGRQVAATQLTPEQEAARRRMLAAALVPLENPEKAPAAK